MKSGFLTGLLKKAQFNGVRAGSPGTGGASPIGTNGRIRSGTANGSNVGRATPTPPVGPANVSAAKPPIPR